MPYDKVLVRTDTDGLTRVFIPTIEANKGYITEWCGNKEFKEVSLSIYKETTDAPIETSRAKFQDFLRQGARKPARLAVRLPKDYQKFSGGSYTLKHDAGLYFIEDAHGILVMGTADKGKAIDTLRKLTKGEHMRL